MKRLFGGGVLAVLLLLGLSSAGAGATAPTSTVSAQDAASTNAFIALQERYDIDTIRSAAAINAAGRAFVAQIRTGCSGVLDHLPKHPSKRQGGAIVAFLYESFAALDINAFTPLRKLVDRIAGRQQRLRFTDPAVQWQVHVNGAANAAYFALRPPANLCIDARLLASSKFTRITPAGNRFSADSLTLSLAAAASPASLVRTMRSYAPAAAAAALKRLPELQRQLDSAIPIERQFIAIGLALGFRRGMTINFAQPGVGS